ncbi:MAG: AAA family ATPase [Candidatus Eisenbacteria bacterium]|nr:AAA family ATPase [Candidatus Eisenbacteria bacterium]
MKEETNHVWPEFWGSNVERALRERHEEEIIRCLVFYPEDCMQLLEAELTRGLTPAPDPLDFETPRFADIFAAILDLRDERKALTAEAIAKRAGQISEGTCNFPQLLLELTDRDPTIPPPLITYWLDALRAAHEDRLISRAIATADPGTVRDVLRQVEDRERVYVRPSTKPEEAARRVLDAILHPEKDTGIRLPFRVPAADRTGNFIRPGDFVILAARPAVGKSIWALWWAVQTALAEQRPVLYASYEMGCDQCWRCAIHAEAYVSRPEKGPLSPPNARHIERAADYLRKNCALHVFDGLPPQVGRAVATLEREAKETDAAAVVIDYLGLMEGRGEREYDQVTDISRTVRGFAQRTQVPVLAIHQFNRSSVGERRPPDLHDLRGSGQLEQDATHVVFLDHPWVRMNEREREAAPALENEVIWKLVKVREGAPCWERMHRRGAMSRLDPAATPTTSPS